MNKVWGKSILGGLFVCAVAWSFICPPQRGPFGMVAFPAGEYTIGSEEGSWSEAPVHSVRLKAWYLDKNLVTVGEFRAFVRARRYKTQAEKLGDAGVFDFRSGEWSLVKGACWHHPQGPAGPPAPEDHPVTQVSWYDAQAYCRWQKKRLPYEAEWEASARYGHSAKYAWGKNDYAGRANVWNGSFPDTNTREDGFLTTSPVGQFGRGPQGLYDMGGNVWQWCADYFHPYPGYVGTWPQDSPQERVQRGGSFLCDSAVCHGYRVSARSHSSSETALMHVGFRCACSAETK